MTEDQPYELPSPTMVAELLAQAAWDNDIADDHRLRCEMGADTIRRLMRRLIDQARTLETVEAEQEELLAQIDRRMRDDRP